MPRRHTIWVESVPDTSAHVWEGERQNHARHNGDGLVPIADSSMEVCEEEQVVNELAVPEQVPQDKAPFDHEQSQDVEMEESLAQDVKTHTKDLSQISKDQSTDHGMAGSNDDGVSLNTVMVPSAESSLVTMSSGLGIDTVEDAMFVPTSKEIVVSGVLPNTQEPNRNVAHSMETEIERPKTPVAQTAMALDQDQTLVQAQAQAHAQALSAASSPKGSVRDPSSPSVSRRSTAHHTRTRPTTIHGEPSPLNHPHPGQGYFAQETALPRQPYQTPPPQDDGQSIQVNGQDNHRRQPSSTIVYNQSQAQQSSPALFPDPHGSNFSTPPHSPVIPTRRDSLGATLPFPLPLSPPSSSRQQQQAHQGNGYHHLQQQQQQVYRPQHHKQTHRSSHSYQYPQQQQAAAPLEPATVAPRQKSHRKNPSTSGRILGFLGGLSKKNGESMSVPASPKFAQENGTFGQPQQHQQQQQKHGQVQSHPPPSPSSAFHHQQQQQQQQQQQGTYQQGVTVEAVESQKSGHSQRGKRRKTLSLVAGSSDRPVTQLHQAMTRPPLPMDGSYHHPSGSGTGTASKIMGWLRRKSI
ncbi:hypothetical protein BGZ94_003565, partial [Podila epigama]